jgi:alpha-tubulin suppressor-like RCC1 family protein
MTMAAGKKAFVFGNNQVGQLGISFGEDFALNPQEISHVEADMIATVALNQNQTFLVLNNGSLLSSGENDNNELARSGKRSYLHRVDALETFQIQEAATGLGFTTLVCDDGRLVSWGKNDMGQLCNGTRENKDKPRVNASIQEPILQVASGATHSIALTKTGRVVVWGGNRWGQLGDGQLTSSTKLLSPIQLRHRPVISVTCGENHSLVMTTGGNVYSWGENSLGQLGLSDTTSRLRPELVKAFRSMGATKIAAGRNHSLVISQGGLLLAFGSNNHGQCGIDSEVKIQPQPTVVERLRELRAVDVCGGFAHTMVLCESRSADSMGDGGQRKPARVYMMGLNSSGQVTFIHVLESICALFSHRYV